jgi:hypothetical protein
LPGTPPADPLMKAFFNAAARGLVWITVPSLVDSSLHAGSWALHLPGEAAATEQSHWFQI